MADLRNPTQPLHSYQAIMWLQTAIMFSLTSAVLTNGSLFSPFSPALDSWDGQISSNDTSFELLKRASNACPTSYSACTNEGASALCCADSQICTADYNGNVACCPSGAKCTGTITGVVTGSAVSGTTTTSNVLASTTQSTTTTSGAGLIYASTATSTTTTGGFIVAASTTVATIVSGGTRNQAVSSILTNM